ncbi:MAG: glycosyltransferase family 39 protein [Polyangiaceae bacterium]
MSQAHSQDERGVWGDVAVAIAMGLLTFVLLYLTAPRIGYARDEGFYFQAAKQYGHWLDVLFADPVNAVRRDVVDAHFSLNAEHPSLMKLLFALSEAWLHRRLEWIAQPGLAYRVPSMALAAITTTMLVGFTARILSRGAGVLAGALLVGLPRWFHHAHLACFDVPIASWIFLTTLCYRHATSTRRASSAWLLGLVYGLALDTKHNAWWLPATFFVHLVVTEGRAFLASSAVERWRTLRPLVVMVLVGPCVMVLLWPWLWYDTVPRLEGWLRFHLHHEYYNMKFLGQTYHRPPMPRAYPWVMTLATVPATTLVLSLLGAAVSTTHLLRTYLNAKRSNATRNERPTRVAAWDLRRSTDLLLALSIVSAYAPWVFTSTPIFGGTKHWLAAYPFLCVFAGRGYLFWSARMREFVQHRKVKHPRLFAAFERAAFLALILPGVAITSHGVPWGLTTYTPVVGGAPGAANLGLNRTFWGYTTLELIDAFGQLAPEGARVFVHDTAIQSFQEHQLDGTIERKYVPTLNIAQSTLALYHYEPHMQRVEYQIFEAYGTTTPSAMACFDGVPVVWLYARK